MTPATFIHRPSLRLVAVADSIAMPREEDGRWLHPEATWPAQLEARLRAGGLEAEVLNRGKRNWHSFDLDGPHYREDVTYTQPDVVLLEIGVNDCSPRLFTLREKRVLGHAWFPRRLRDALIRYYSRHRLRIIGPDPMRKVHTRPPRFRANLEAFLDRLGRDHPACRVVLLPIVCDSSKCDAKSPGFSDNVQRYNALLADLARERGLAFVPLDTMMPRDVRLGGRLFFPDGFHVTAEGSALMAAALEPVVLDQVCAARSSA